MKLIYGFLAAAMLAASAASAPTPPANCTPASNTSTDDLIEMARNRGDVERSATIHFHPDRDLVISEDTDLSGTYVVRSFSVGAGVIVVATSDLTVIASELVNIEGAILGAHGFVGDGVSVVLRSFDWLSITGEVRSGDGGRGETFPGGTASKGGDLWVASPAGVAPGQLWPGAGGHGEVAVHGGDGGDGILVGGIRGTQFLRAPTVHGGRGGNGGASEVSRSPEFFPIAGDGGAGGDGLSLSFAEARRLTAKRVPLAVRTSSFVACAAPFAIAAAPSWFGFFAMLQSSEPQLTPCEAGAGAAGTDSTEDVPTEEGQGGGTAATPEACCTAGMDGSGHGADGIGGPGGLGGPGKDAPGPAPGNGGSGGAGGDGGFGTGGVGQNGGDASRCCATSGPGCAAFYSKQGGDGAIGGVGTGGAGGGGGAGGSPIGDCMMGKDGPGGFGGNAVGGDGGNGGNAGESRSGMTDPNEMPVKGKGGSGGGEDKQSGGGPNGIPGWNDTDNPPPGHLDQYLDDLDDAAEDPDWPEGWSNKGNDGEDGSTTGARCA